MSSLGSFCGLCKELINLASHASQDPGAFYLTKDACFHQTAPSCPLCELLRYAFAQQHGEAALRAWDTEELLPHPVGITFNYSRVPQDEDRCSEANLVLGNRDVTLALWAHEQGTTAATTFITRPQIADSHSGQPVHLIRSLLQDCLRNHDQCAHSKASDLPVADHDAHLPTRVLDIRPGPDPDLPTVRLLETNGARGQYCALSHCWGPPEKRPLRTLHSNLAHHLDDIPFAHLPNTFREAALFTLRLGIRYLWIDSLCIVQDDREDWAREAQVMGALYQGALLVIAAAGASDSTRGLFVSDRAQLREIRVPFLSSKSNDKAPGAFHISTVPKGHFDPSMSILRERGWVYQEWYLARRIVFSMPGGLVWRCAEYNLDELGVHTPHETELNESSDWYQLLRGYTSKKLTYASDRLDALWGISEEVKKRSGGGNLWGNFKNGVWDSSLMTHLLWKTVARPTEGQDDLPNLPSWTCKLAIAFDLGGIDGTSVTDLIYFYRGGNRGRKGLGTPPLQVRKETRHQGTSQKPPHDRQPGGSRSRVGHHGNPWFTKEPHRPRPSATDRVLLGGSLGPGGEDPGPDSHEKLLVPMLPDAREAR